VADHRDVGIGREPPQEGVELRRTGLRARAQDHGVHPETVGDLRRVVAEPAHDRDLPAVTPPHRLAARHITQCGRRRVGTRQIALDRRREPRHDDRHVRGPVHVANRHPSLRRASAGIEHEQLPPSAVCLAEDLLHRLDGGQLPSDLQVGRPPVRPVHRAHGRGAREPTAHVEQPPTGRWTQAIGRQGQVALGAPQPDAVGLVPSPRRYAVGGADEVRGVDGC